MLSGITLSWQESRHGSKTHYIHKFILDITCQGFEEKKGMTQIVCHEISEFSHSLIENNKYCFE